MSTGKLLVMGVLVAAWMAAALIVPAQGSKEEFVPAAAIPDDVFLFSVMRHDPDRAFLDEYWGEVFEALSESGIGDDVFQLLNSMLGTEHAAEVERLTGRAQQLLEGVDWEQLGGGEVVFVERFDPPTVISDESAPVLIADLVWMFRGSGGGSAANYEGLTAILSAVVDEVNGAVGAPVLTMKRSEQKGAKVASVDLLAMAPGAPSLPLTVALRGEVVIIALRDGLLGDVLALMDGSSSKTALADDARFKAAFARLPAPDSTLTYFDMQALMKPLRMFVDVVVQRLAAPRDVYLNTEMSADVGRLNAQALAASSNGDYGEALALVRKAHESSPENSIVLYNLACFHARVGNRHEALGWLKQAVEGGFHAPGKIAGDPDLHSLRDEKQYKAALDRAAELAAEWSAEDHVANSSKAGEPARLSAEAWEAYEKKDYEQGLRLVEQAYALAPEDSRVLYYLACFHAMLGHRDTALGFLEKSVEGGFYCPRHISKDPDLESIRDSRRYEAAVAQARTMAAKMSANQAGDKLGFAGRLIDRLADALVLDYVASVDVTDGYSVRTESIAALVPDARERPIYAVFGQSEPAASFDRYLPQEAESFSISAEVDLEALYTFLEDTLREAGPQGEKMLAQWTEIQKQLGVNIRKDVIGWIGGTSISVTLADDAGSVWLIQVRDEQLAREKVGAAIEMLSTGLGELIAKQPALAGLGMLSVFTTPTDHEQLEGFENIHFAFSPEPAVWGVSDGHLVFGSSAEAAALCLATARGEHPNLRENARVMSEAIVPTGSFASVSLTDHRSLGEDMATGIGIASMVGGTAGSFIPQPEVRLLLGKLSGMLAKLTPVVRKIDFYKSSASCVTFDGQNWHTQAVTHYFSPAERAAKGKH